MSHQQPDIIIEGASQNNLKNVDLKIKPGELTVITGRSGTGKSTLLFDVIHAEGQRRYVETFSPYVRQFLDSLPRPKVEAIYNARPSIAIEQKNTVRNSRSTVGTMTELCDYFKVWFSEVASLYDSVNGKLIENKTTAQITEKILKVYKSKILIFGFRCGKPKQFSKKEFVSFLKKSGHNRVFFNDDFKRLDSIDANEVKENKLFVVVDRIKISESSKKRVRESINLAIEHGQGIGEVRDEKGKKIDTLVLDLRSKEDFKLYQAPSPNLFSFNSPLGACRSCKGFGKNISIDPHKIIPDESLSLINNAIKPFSGNVYGHCKDELLFFCKRVGIDPNSPYSALTKSQKDLIWKGEDNYKDGSNKWYGIEAFFTWLEKKTYKMHVRVFLSKYRGYFICQECNGNRLQQESLCWKWKKHTLPSLYSKSVNELLNLLPQNSNSKDKSSVALNGIRTRLGYLNDVGLGYLSLDRAAKTLSGGETQRVNLTSCLGSSLTDALFALDEPTIGLHGKDIGKLISILKKLADAGNCVCVVEHDEQVIRSADKVIEIGPLPGKNGGEIIFQGNFKQLLKSKSSLTGQWLSKRNNSLEKKFKKIEDRKGRGQLKVIEASVHNLKQLSVNLPLGKFVCLAGVSGSGKSTLLHDVIYKQLADNPQSKTTVYSEKPFEEIVLIDQNTIYKTPRSNPILYADGWSPIKEALARTEEAKKLGLFATDFSFNSGNGRCSECKGLGYEIVEMQFLSDLQTPCGYCEGMRFKEEVLGIKLKGLSVSDILNLTIEQAIEVLKDYPKTYKKLNSLNEVGLGYLTLGQPLNTLSGGESQRLKLVKYMNDLSSKKKHSILLIDEPTTGLHMQDIDTLVKVFRKIVLAGHSLFIIEHNSQLLKEADWIVEMGPGSGSQGGQIIANGTPFEISQQKTATAQHLISSNINRSIIHKRVASKINECKARLEIIGANENNLKNISLKIPHRKFVVVTGPSGSGKSSLAFDVIFAEGQRRYMDSMSAYARQFVEQLARPRVEKITGMQPTVAIEQRVSRGSKKSTVGSITEVTQYLRLLYAKLGVQLSEKTKTPLAKSSTSQILKHLKEQIQSFSEKEFKNVLLLAPLISGRKGHHKPIVNWASDNGFKEVRCDGKIYPTNNFEGLERYQVHDIEAVTAKWQKKPPHSVLRDHLTRALEVGNGRCILATEKSDTWFSTKNVDPQTGTAYPDLEPYHFSWNSPKGMCSFCKGYGKIYDWMKEELPASGEWWKLEDGSTCPECNGQRLSSTARHVVLFNQKNHSLTLPELLSLPPKSVIEFLHEIKVNKYQKIISDSTIPEIIDRLNFMDRVGLGYLCLNRETSSLSGGEAQRIRLAGQLGSNLSGVLYVLDEPSIGLHPVDNQRLIESLRELQQKGNSLIVVEHDQETINQADFLIEIGPKAGEKGGQLVSLHENDIWQVKEPILNENYSSFSQTFRRQKLKVTLNRKSSHNEWLTLKSASLRNVSNLSLRIPVGRLSVCCGVSGSGKSTLIRGILHPLVHLSISQNSPKSISEHGTILNGNIFGRAVEVDQKPIGKTSRSTPVTYLGVWDRIRSLFSQLPEAKTRGYSSSSFSFNIPGGRCEKCKGNGKIKLEMNFLPDSFVLCDSCHGRRFSEQVLELRWNSKNIFEVLDMTMKEASEFFEFDYVLKNTFELMTETGLGYLKLGQTSPSLSGGEAQRLKLGAELSKVIDKKKFSQRPSTKNNLYILEEPTIGLHHVDRVKLFRLLRRLVGEGNTIVVIEHDLDFIANADYVFEMGPEGGDQGGRCIFQGSSEKMLKIKQSRTSPFMRKYFT